MISSRRRNVTDLSALVLGLLIGLVLAALLLPLARAEAEVDAGPPAVAALDPVVAADHADRVQSANLDLVEVPPIRFSPTRYAEFAAWLDRAGENTGGAWLAALAAIGIRRARRRWPQLRRGWTDEVTATALAGSAWVAGSLATGATWGTAALGVVMAALAGTLIAMVPGERPVKDEGGGTEAGGLA